MSNTRQNSELWAVLHVSYNNMTLYFQNVVLVAKHNKIFSVQNDKSDRDLVKLGNEQQTCCDYGFLLLFKAHCQCIFKKQ